MSSNSAHDSGDDPLSKQVDPLSKDMELASSDGALWNLDDDEFVDSMSAKAPGSVGEGIPPAKLTRAPRVVTGLDNKVGPQSDPRTAEQTDPPDEADYGVKLNVQQQNAAKWPETRVPETTDHSRKLDDLDAWIDDGGNFSGKDIEDNIELPKLETAPEETVVPAPVESEVSNPSLQANPPLVKRQPSDYSMLEKFGMTALIISLLAVLAGVLIYSATRLPVESVKSRDVKFPISGKHVTVRAAKTYWRDVVQSGPQADVVRRGTRMIPVLELSCTGGPGFLRILFRDENGDSVGDTITRQVTAGGNFTIASTAGFNDVGMHAAYRTGEGKPWKLEVYEGGEANVSGDGFIKLFEMDIATERR